MANPSFQVKIHEDGLLMLIVHDLPLSVDNEATYFQFDPGFKNRFSFQRYPHSSGYSGAVVTAVITNRSPYNRLYGTLIFWSNEDSECFSVESGESRTVSFPVGAEYKVSFQPGPRPFIEFVEIEAIKRYVALTHLVGNRRASVINVLSEATNSDVSDTDVSQWFELLESNAAKWPAIEAGLKPFADLVIACASTMTQYAGAIVAIIKTMSSYEVFSAKLDALPADQQVLEAAVLNDVDMLKVSLIEEALTDMSNGLAVFIGAGEKFNDQIEAFKTELMNNVRPLLEKLINSPQLKEPLGSLSDALVEVAGRLNTADIGIGVVHMLWINTVEFTRNAKLKVPNAQELTSFKGLERTLIRAAKDWKDTEKNAQALKEVLTMYS